MGFEGSIFPSVGAWKARKKSTAAATLWEGDNARERRFQAGLDRWICKGSLYSGFHLFP